MISYREALLLVLIGFFALNDVNLECVKSNSAPLKAYEIDLDKPARERFFQVTFDFRDEIKILIEARK